MINFVIVDDNNLQRKKLNKIIFSKMMNNKIDFNILEFDDYNNKLMKYIEKNAHESKDIKPVTTEFIRRLNAEYGSILCKDIKPQSFQPDIRCRATVETVCDVLEQVIAEHDKM